MHPNDVGVASASGTANGMAMGAQLGDHVSALIHILQGLDDHFFTCG
jgi:hypothetical protein